MKRMVVNIFLLTVFLLVCNIMDAQQKISSTPEERSNKLTGWMKTNLQLNDGQTKQVQTINLKYANKTQELQAASLSRKEKMHTLKENDRAKDAELKNVFTTDQYRTYQTKKDEIRKQMKERMREKKTNNKVT